MIVHNTSLSELQERVKNYSFVAEKIVNAEIFEVEPKKTDSRFDVLIG